MQLTSPHFRLNRTPATAPVPPQNHETSSPASPTYHPESRRCSWKTLTSLLYHYNSLRDREKRKLEKEVQELRESISRLEHDNHHLDKEIDDTKGRIHQMDQRKKRSGETMKELTAAQRFLSSADTHSQADLIRMVESLNEQVYQISAFVADSLGVEGKKKVITNRDWKKIYFWRLPPALGPAFLDLVVPIYLESGIVIQLGWQAILVDWCGRVIMEWFEGHPKVNRGLEEIYRGILATNEPAVSGRWRAITHTAITQVSPPNRDKLIERVIEKLTALPVVCGYATTQEAYDKLREVFQSRLGPLLEKCFEIRKVLAEGVTSMDIRTYSCPSGVQYAGEDMDAEYEDENADGQNDKLGMTRKRDVVACSLSLGMVNVTKTREDRDGSVLEKTENILKAKVILHSALYEIIS